MENIKHGLSGKLSRRELLQKSGVSFPFSAQAKTETLVNDSAEQVRHSACLVNCGSRCPLKVIVKDDRIIRIEAEESPNESIFGQHQIRPCLRGRASRWRVYSPDRIKYPMQRVGKRGEGKFKRIKWQDAITLIAKQLERVKQQYGNESIYYNYQSGASGH